MGKESESTRRATAPVQSDPPSLDRRQQLATGPRFVALRRGERRLLDIAADSSVKTQLLTEGAAWSQAAVERRCPFSGCFGQTNRWQLLVDLLASVASPKPSSHGYLFCVACRKSGEHGLPWIEA